MGKEKAIKKYLVSNDDLFPQDTLAFFMQLHIDEVIERIYSKLNIN